jgi:adenylosuccinate synthase
MKANIVVGLLFGDEGKGRTISWLVEQNKDKNQIVVRFSGGQQAGHNVVHKNVGHIFSNFGSGTLQGCETYYTKHCTLYPNTIQVEANHLYRKTNKQHKVIAHPLTMITTPYDIIYNRITEMKNHHGSVGLGVGATMKRNIETPYKLYAIDILYPNLFKEKLNKIKNYYENLVGGLAFSSQCESKINEIDFKKEIERYCDTFDKNIIINDESMLSLYDVIHFEGSQGIMLDMDHGIFPHVTYGNTTSKNAIEVCKNIGVDDIDMYYVTRCYQTRHGNGWMSNENKDFQLVNNQHEINKKNFYQGKFRLGEFDLKLINQAYLIDKIYSGYLTKDNMVVTCLDQRPNFELDVNKIVNHMMINNIYQSYSPNTNDMKMLYSDEMATESLSDS